MKTVRVTHWTGQLLADIWWAINRIQKKTLLFQYITEIKLANQTTIRRADCPSNTGITMCNMFINMQDNHLTNRH